MITIYKVNQPILFQLENYRLSTGTRRRVRIGAALPLDRRQPLIKGSRHWHVPKPPTGASR